LNIPPLRPLIDAFNEAIRRDMKEDTETLAELMLHADQFCSRVEDSGFGATSLVAAAIS
jgi:hypothetical protein